MGPWRMRASRVDDRHLLCAGSATELTWGRSPGSRLREWFSAVRTGLAL